MKFFSGKTIFVISIILVGVLLLAIFLLNAPSPHKKRIKHLVKHPSPVSTLTRSPRQDTNTVLDEVIPSTGCAEQLLLNSDATTNEAITYGQTTRSYLIHLPPGYNNSIPHALILSFHGYSSDDYDEERISRFDTIADNTNSIVVYPNGTTGLLANRGWNTGLHPTITANDVLFVSNLLNKLQSNLCINPKQIYASGFSNGGGFVAELACRLSNRIAAFAPISGSYLTSFATCSATRGVPIIEFHGTADDTAPYKGYSALKELATQAWLRDWAVRDQCTQGVAKSSEVDNVTKYVWNHCKDNAEIVHYKIIGGVHAWPERLFTVSTDATAAKSNVQYLTAADIIWNFFKQHPLP